MKILFYQRTDVINSAGGTEKVLCFLSSSLAERGYDVVFMTNENKEGTPFFKLNDKVKFINIGGTSFKGFQKNIFKLIKSTKLLNILSCFNNYKYTSDVVYKYINQEKPDLIILANPQDLVEVCYSHTYNVPIIQMIHGVPWNIFHRKSKTVSKITLSLMKNVKVCQVLMPSFVDLMKPYYSGEITVIPNSIPQTDKNIDYSNQKDKFIIANVGRLAEVKNQELIIKAFAKIYKKYPQWEVDIWGNGSEKYTQKLTDLIEEFGLKNKVILKGTSKNILHELEKCDIFIFPSLFEGFGIALGEAMSVGLPSIGLRTAPAVNELIVDNTNGILIDNDVDDLVLNLEKLINNADLRKKLGTKAKEMIKNYSEENVLNSWEELIKKINKN